MNFDFEIMSAGNGAPNMSLIVANNEDAYNFLIEEQCLFTNPDGSAPIPVQEIGDFMSDASWAHFSCAYL